MSFASTRFGIGAALATGVMFALSLDLGPWGALALLAPVPLLIHALAAPRAWSVCLLAMLARVVGLAGIVQAYHSIIPLPALIAAALVFAVLFAAVVLFARWVAAAAPAAIAVLAYPLALSAMEWGFGLVAPHGSFGAMGYALVDVLPLLQVASIGGVPALTFCVALVPAAVAVAVTRPADRRVALLMGAVPIVAALAFGAVRLQLDYTAHARVALVAIDSTEALAYRGESQDVSTAQSYAEIAHEVAASRPDFIVLPEKQFGGARQGGGAGEILDAAARAAAPATLIAGFDEVLADGTRVNAARIHSDGAVQRYVKRRLIPGVEFGYSVGPGSYVAGTHGVAICKDLDFPAMIRDYGRRGVQLLLVPAWDFVVDGRMHSRMAVVRGVENGFAIARAAESGRLTASDAFGRIVGEVVTTRERPATLVADLGLYSGGSLYARSGDAFAWSCVLLVIALAAWRALAAFSGRSRAGRA